MLFHQQRKLFYLCGNECSFPNRLAGWPVLIFPYNWRSRLDLALLLYAARVVDFSMNRIKFNNWRFALDFKVALNSRPPLTIELFGLTKVLNVAAISKRGKLYCDLICLIISVSPWSAAYFNAGLSTRFWIFFPCVEYFYKFGKICFDRYVHFSKS